MKYFRQYIDENEPEEITREITLSVLRDNYPGLDDTGIEKMLPLKELHSPTALYWSEKSQSEKGE